MAIDSRAETLALQGIVIEDSTITSAQSYAVRYEMGDTVMLRRVTSAGSGEAGEPRPTLPVPQFGDDRRPR